MLRHPNFRHSRPSTPGLFTATLRLKMQMSAKGKGRTYWSIISHVSFVVAASVLIVFVSMVIGCAHWQEGFSRCRSIDFSSKDVCVCETAYYPNIYLKVPAGEAKLPRLQRSSNHGLVQLDAHIYQARDQYRTFEFPTPSPRDASITVAAQARCWFTIFSKTGIIFGPRNVHSVLVFSLRISTTVPCHSELVESDKSSWRKPNLHDYFS
jgi:hypothetical protein